MIQINNIRRVFERAGKKIDYCIFHLNTDNSIWVPTKGIFHETILASQYDEEKENDSSRKE